jgi:asparagine synthase (glutamine-hydrolysing)
MCGIAGWFNSSENKIQLEAMLQCLKHRGPEGTGYYQSELVSFGNTRLAFVDLPTGQQPLSNESGTIWLTCNGEIFNHLELRQQLAQRHTFKTNCDVEVILHLYEEYGIQGFTLLNGQYAFAIWDTLKQEFILCRDRLGICPLFFTFVDERLYFASEIKAFLSVEDIKPEIDLETLQAIWTLWTSLPQKTLFKNIYEVLPAHYIILKAGERVAPQKSYWQLDFNEKNWSEDSALETFMELFDNAVRIRLQADVPIAAYLSGGVDSSLIAAFASKYASELHTFSIAFQHPDFDESKQQSIVANHLGTKHHVTRYTADDLASALPKMVWHTELPQLRAGPISMLLLSQSVNQHHFKAVLTGEGADEFFMGYDIFKETAIRRFMSRKPESSLRRLLVQRLYSYLPDRDKLRGLEIVLQEDLEQSGHPFFSHSFRWKNTARLQGYFLPEIRAEFSYYQTEEHLLEIMPSSFSEWSWSAKAQTLEIITFLTPYLLASQGDRVAMANAVEGRFPFLDHRLVEFANSLPINLKLRSLKKDKYVLRKVAAKFLPAEIAERPKFPYRAPIQDIFRSKAFADSEELLSEDNLKATGLFSTQAVHKLLKKVKDDKVLSEMEQMALMGIVTTQSWHHSFIQKKVLS